MKVLVTGSAGFVGRHLVEALDERGDEAVGLDKKTGDDLTGNDDIAKVVVELFHPDVIVHLASTCSTPGSVRDPMTTYNDTVYSAVRVLEAARESKTPVLLTSSVKARDGMTPYGAAKLMVETWALEYKAAFGLPLIINRPGTIYGPGQEGSDESGWIAWFLKAKAEGLPVILNDGGHQTRDLLHVSDYVELMLTQIDHFERYSRRSYWDVGGGPLNKVTVIDMACHLGLEWTGGPARYGDASEYVGENGVPFWTPRIHWRDSGMFG